MKARLVLCFVLTVTLGVSTASAAYVTHTGQADPTTESWTWNDQELNAPTLAGGNDTKDYWGMAGTSNQGGGYQAPATSAELLADWRLTAIMEVVSNTPVQPGVVGVQGNVTLSAADSNTFLNMKFGEDTHVDEEPVNGLWLYQDNSLNWITLATLNTSEYHRYDVVFDAAVDGVVDFPNDTYTFYLDTIQVAQVTRNDVREHVFDQIFWGDVSDFEASESRWNLVEFTDDLTIPEGGGDAIPGDFDADNDVDGTDFGIWQSGYPTASGASLGTGDADADGDVDGTDFGIWQANYPTNVGGAAAIPEPATLALLGFAGLAMLVRRRRI